MPRGGEGDLKFESSEEEEAEGELKVESSELRGEEQGKGTSTGVSMARCGEGELRVES